jgi:hypothetical protein
MQTSLKQKRSIESAIANESVNVKLFSTRKNASDEV